VAQASAARVDTAKCFKAAEEGRRKEADTATNPPHLDCMYGRRIYFNNMSETEPVEGNRKTTMKRDANRYGR
jgi:hypothetical protein